MGRTMWPTHHLYRILGQCYCSYSGTARKRQLRLVAATFCFIFRIFSPSEWENSRVCSRVKQQQDPEVTAVLCWLTVKSVGSVGHLLLTRYWDLLLVMNTSHANFFIEIIGDTPFTIQANLRDVATHLIISFELNEICPSNLSIVCTVQYH